MIESIEFTNFKALRKTTLPLSPFTLLLGPNGSGKSTVLQALQEIARISSENKVSHSRWLSFRSISSNEVEPVGVRLNIQLNKRAVVAKFVGTSQRQVKLDFQYDSGGATSQDEQTYFKRWLSQMRVFSFDASAIAQSFPVTSEPLHSNGAGLAAVLDDLKDNFPERWEQLLAEMRQWLPEYDYIQFDKPEQGQKAISLRTKKGGHRIPATELSQGTLVALALLTLAYLPNPPTLIGLEEIDRGLHPRLLRHLQDALYRLSYPESCGETRPAIQVIATTHSPYLLDLYRDRPQEIVLAQKEGLEVSMRRLSDIEHYDEILGDSPLSEIWYSGILGGVSVKP